MDHTHTPDAGTRPTTDPPASLSQSTPRWFHRLSAPFQHRQPQLQEPPDPAHWPAHDPDRNGNSPEPKRVVNPVVAQRVQELAQEAKAHALWQAISDQPTLAQTYSPEEFLWIVTTLQRSVQRSGLHGIAQANTRMDAAFEQQSDAFKQHTYEAILELGISPEDPLFAVLFATGRLESLLMEKPHTLKLMFEGWSERLHHHLEQCQDRLQHQEQVAVKAQEKEIAAAVKRLILKASFDKVLYGLTIGNILTAGVILALTALAGFWLGQLRQAAVRPNYATGPVRLTLDEVNALNWATSEDGQRARQLWNWNQDLLHDWRCEQQAAELGITLALQGELADQGACVLWVRPVEERILQ